MLRSEEEFYDTAIDYFWHSALQGLKYAEIYFYPRPALENGIAMSEMMAGMYKARDVAIRTFDIDCQWLMTYHRDRSPYSAMKLLVLAEANRENMVGVALDNLDAPCL